MAIALQRFCINRKIAPSLSIEAFFRLVSELGLHKVELRNDLPSGKVTDELTHQQVRKLADRYQLEILTINAVYPFNRHSAEVRQLTESLLKDAQSIGAKSLVMCPLNDGTVVAPQETLAAMRELAPLFEHMAFRAWSSRWASHKVRCARRRRRRHSFVTPRYRLSC